MSKCRDIFPVIMTRLKRAHRERGERGRPFVTLSYAQSIDGSIARKPGRPIALSGGPSKAMTHRLRSLHDAILVGIGTILADDPRLTVRLASGSNPRPIIVDGRLRCPLEANVLKHSNPPFIFTAEDADPGREASLESKGSRVFRIPSSPEGLLDLGTILKKLAKNGIGSVMVEGGAQIITGFLKARLVDQLVLTVAPVFIGGLTAVWPLQLDPLNSPRLRNVKYEFFGRDLVLRADLSWGNE